ncbi:hypothetical protein JOC54_002321 [Alkalihalobacillus xiaoxiensis]|uniref:Uncharacterized protein n=1 Tax=Shouchella xiaoxiensis TaxID=766895 RepID=A0ABS2SVL5_9BACI|nr:hypothetical protein [Shouchella xiaoxiensis]MBM7839051.1 hypothetical protein [Shouchella xiaoxiensis]
MTLDVYYEELDGQLYPVWLMVPAQSSEEYLPVVLNAPFERIEEIHDSMTLVSVTMNALSRDPQEEQKFSIHLLTVYHELQQMGRVPDSLDSAFFLIQMADLEELLQFEVRRLFEK